jgi:hypothetical protein
VKTIPRFSWTLPGVAAATALTIAVAAVLRGPPPAPTAPPPALAQPAPEMIALRSLAKERIAREVTDGKRTLFEAATLFRELDQLEPPVPVLPDPDHGIPLLARFPTDTVDELYCMQVARWVSLQAQPEGPERTARAEQLAELVWQVKRDKGGGRALARPGHPDPADGASEASPGRPRRGRPLTRRPVRTAAGTAGRSARTGGCRRWRASA